MAILLIFAFHVEGFSQVSPTDSTGKGKTGRSRNGVQPDSGRVNVEPSPSNLPNSDEEEEIVRSILERQQMEEATTEDTSLTRRQRRQAGLLPPDPNVAVRRSLVLPGWGQAYNRSWWKIPIVYAGFGVITFFVVDNHRQYKYHQAAAICVQDTNCTTYPEFDGFDVSNVISIRDFHRRYRDLNIIIGGLWYGLQAIDAYIEAHLKPFNVNEDLSMRIRPNLQMDPFRQNTQVYLGATLSLQLRR